MTAGYLKCPQCGASTFWVQDELGHKVLFKVTAQGQPQDSKQPGRDLSLLDFSLIHCFSCGWSGGLDELKR